MKKYLLICLFTFNLLACENKKEIKSTDENTKVIEVVKKENVIPELPKDTIKLNSDSIKFYNIQSKKLPKKVFYENIETSATIEETENSVFKVNSPVQGKVISANFNIGDRINKNQKLIDVQNSEIIKIYSDYIHELHSNEILIKQAQIKNKLIEKSLNREKDLFNQGISAKKDYENAQTEYELSNSEIAGLKEHKIHLSSEARALLNNYNVKLKDDEGENIQSISPIISNHKGIITQKFISDGSNISIGQDIYEISDNTYVYINLSIQDKDISKVKLGQNISFKSEVSNNTFIGKVNFINPNINNQTNTFSVRSKVYNPNGILKAGLFGKALLKISESKPMIYIPFSSVESNGDEKFIFLDIDNNSFKKLVIKPKSTDKNGYFIENDLKEKVVISGSFNLKGELLKSDFKEEE